MWKRFYDFHNAEFIFPTKQKYVYEMVNVIKHDPNIIRAVVFGSSVTPSCHVWSDIDIYFAMEHDVENYPTTGSMEAVFDKWTNFSVSMDLLKEINRTGVIVYERGLNNG